MEGDRKPHPIFRMVPVWMTFSDLLKVTINQRQITWNGTTYSYTNNGRPIERKAYMIYRTAPLSMTLNDSYIQFHGRAILWRWIYHKRFDVQT